jgi:hypothetical protein
MKKRTLLMALLPLMLSACATLYSTRGEWRLPGGFGNYVLSAQMSVGFLTRQITISVNDRELMTGQGYWWADNILLSGTLEGFPIDAVCNQQSKKCDVNIVGIHAATLSF